MASRGGGSRPTGTDGTDFMHRQRVASQYAISAETKKYVKYSIYMHFMLSIIIMVQLAFHFGNKQLAMALPEVPTPNIWQYIWLTSLLPGLAGYLSLNRSRLSLMRIYYTGTVLLGLGPVLTTMVFNATDLLEYAQTKQTDNLYHDFPVLVLWYMYLFVVLQIHAFGIYFARILIRTWSGAKDKRN